MRNIDICIIDNKVSFDAQKLYKGEHNYTVLNFSVGSEYLDFKKYIDIEYTDKTGIIQKYRSDQLADYNDLLFSFTIEQEFTYSNTIKLQAVFIDINDVIGLSEEFELKTIDSINAAEFLPSFTPTDISI